MRLYVCPCCNRTIAHEPPCWKYRNRRKRIGYWWLYGFLAVLIGWVFALYSFYMIVKRWRCHRENKMRELSKKNI